MRTPSFIRSLSSRLSVARRSASSTVVPVAEESRFLVQVTAELDALRSSECDVGSAGWLRDVLGATVVTQQLAQEFLNTTSSTNLSDIDREMIRVYLEDNVELLDACNGLVEKTGVIRNYVDSFKAVTRLSHTRSSDPNVRAREVLSRCHELERQCATLDKSSSKLYKSMGRKSLQVGNGCHSVQDLELQEVLRVSKEVALVACHRLRRALSLKSKQGLVTMKPTIWSNVMNEDTKHQKKSMSPMMNELEPLVTAHRLLQDQVKSRKENMSIDFDPLKRNCEALEKEVKSLEESVQELYRHLISIRVTLLGILSHS